MDLGPVVLGLVVGLFIGALAWACRRTGGDF